MRLTGAPGRPSPKQTCAHIVFAGCAWTCNWWLCRTMSGQDAVPLACKKGMDAIVELAVLSVLHIWYPSHVTAECVPGASSQPMVVMALCAALQVKLILALIQNVTGIKLNAFFAPVSSNGDVAESPHSEGFMWQRADGFGHAVRRWIIRRVLAQLRQAVREKCVLLPSQGSMWHCVNGLGHVGSALGHQAQPDTSCAEP